MSRTTPTILGLAAVLLLSSCGKKSEPADVKPEVKTLTTTAPDKAESTPAAPVVSREDAKRRKMVELLRTRLAEVKDEIERAEVLGHAKDLAGAAKPILDLVVAAAKDKDPMVRGAAVEAIAAIDPEGARAHLETALKDGDAEVRTKAAEGWLLAKLKDLAPLIALAKEEIDPRVQVAALLAVEKLGDASLVAKVAGTLASLDPLAAKPALRFLIANKAAAIPHADKILDLLTWRDSELRGLAAAAIGTLEVRSKPAFEGLIRGLADDAEGVRKAAFESLKALTGNNFEYDPGARPGVAPKAEALIRALSVIADFDRLAAPAGGPRGW